METSAFVIDPIVKLSKDLKNAARVLKPNGARFLVDNYYQIQEMRKRFANQMHATFEVGEPNELLGVVV